MKQEPSILLLKGARTLRAIKRHGIRYEAGAPLPLLSEDNVTELGREWVDLAEAHLVEVDGLGRELASGSDIDETQPGANGLSGQGASAAGDEGKPAATNSEGKAPGETGQGGSLGTSAGAGDAQPVSPSSDPSGSDTEPDGEASPGAQGNEGTGKPTGTYASASEKTDAGAEGPAASTPAAVGPRRGKTTAKGKRT